MAVDIRRGSSRFVERSTGRSSWHSFSFGEHYDPERLSFGPMVCHDEHLLGSGAGFDDHAHEGLEIVTWVVSGSVVHADSLGGSAVLEAGSCGVLSAGSGVRHTEVASGNGPARFVQVWLTPSSPDRDPAYDRATVEGTGLVPVVGDGGPLAVDVPGASFGVARLEAGDRLSIPAAAKTHVFVAAGALLRFSLAEPLSAGDAFLMTDEPTHEVTAAVPSQLLVWSFA